MENIRRLDLNLLVVFDAIMQRRNVSRAAADLGVTQSTISNALKRLRHSLGDPLFVRESHGPVVSIPQSSSRRSISS